MITFCLAALTPAISTRVAALTATLAQNKASKEKPDKDKNTAQSKQGQPVDSSQYVGGESCAECHAAEAAHYALTAHSKTNVGSAPVDKRSCEACHGPAKGHVDFYLNIQKLNEAGKEDEATALMNDSAKASAARMLSFKEMSSAESSAMCLKCHEGYQCRSEERFNFRRSEHFRHGVSCNDCHSSHAPKRTEFLLKASEPGMRYQCHADQKASFAKPFHHKVPEGGMKCSDCHNQHDGFMSKSLRNSFNGDSTCVKCHADKQGPFIYERAPVKVEGCQACLSFGAITFAQSSVEKGETSQQAREPESELERARSVVIKPGENKPARLETGRIWGVYSTTTTFEIGHRFVDTDGSPDRYLSDVNVRDGFRLLEYSTDMRAQPGAGLLFDFLKADVSNAGGDQSQTFSFRMDKTRAYRFDGNVRRFNYYRSPGPNFAHNFLNHDLRQQVSDFSLKLFPHRAVRINAGYGRSVE